MAHKDRNLPDFTFYLFFRINHKIAVYLNCVNILLGTSDTINVILDKKFHKISPHLHSLLDEDIKEIVHPRKMPFIFT